MEEIYEKALKVVLLVAVVACITSMIVASICCLAMANNNSKWIEAIYNYDYPSMITNEQTINQ